MKRLVTIALALTLALFAFSASAGSWSYNSSGRGKGAWQGFSPTWNPNALVYLKDGTGITTATGVSQWTDQIKQNAFTQATGAKQPTVNASDSTFGGMPSYSYLAASSQNLKSGTLNIAQPATYYVVGQTSIAAGNFIDSGGTAQVTWTQSSNLAMYSGTTVTGSAAVSSPRIICSVFNGASSLGYVSSPTVAVLTGNPGSQTEASMWIGGGGAGPFHTGKIAEVVAISGADNAYWRSLMFAYEGNRFKIAISP